MRYIGSKRLILEDIKSVVTRRRDDIGSVLDIFAGTGVVSRMFKSMGLDVGSNDYLYFSYCLQRCHILLNEPPDFSRLGGDPIGLLNGLEPRRFDPETCFVLQNYSPYGSERMYFKPENAYKIDAVRQQIELWRLGGEIDEDGYYYLLASLLEAVPYVSNIAGVYAAYLKFWERRSQNELLLKKPSLVPGAGNNSVFNLDYRKLGGTHYDLVYADPPYNARQYLPNYHVLETIARYDNPTINGVAGIREWKGLSSDFCRKPKVKDAFKDLIEKTDARFFLISYSTEGLLGMRDLLALCRERSKPGSLTVDSLDYRRYKSKIPNNSDGLKEQLIFFEKE